MKGDPPSITVYSGGERFDYVGLEWTLEHSPPGDIIIRYQNNVVAHFRRWESYHATPPSAFDLTDHPPTR